MTSVTCPSDEQLLAMAAGGSADAALQSHVGQCPGCRDRLARHKSQVEGLREALTGSVQAAPTADEGTIPPVGGAIGIGAAAGGGRTPPHTIGKYRVVCLLGVGGQGQVYRAWDADLDKDVVIKLSLQPLPRGGAARVGLGDEGRLLAGLDHPALARVHYLGVHRAAATGEAGEAEYPFLVMEYIRGRNLRQFAEQSRPTARESARIVARIARALSVAHRKGAVHQDLKPQNILIDEAGEPRLIDFGLARLEQAWSDSIRPLGGTISYMSPEQARAYRGSQRSKARSTSVLVPIDPTSTEPTGADPADQIGPASDLFSLGAVLYFLVTGRAPYAGAAFEVLLERTCRGDWDREPLRAANVPRLSAVVERAMAAKPRERYINGDALAGDLEQFLHRPRKLKRRAIAAGALSGLLLAGGAGLHWGWRPHRPVAPVAQAVAWMVPAPDDTWDSEGDYMIVRVSQLHVQNAAGRPCLLRATLRAAGAEAGLQALLVHGDYAFTPRDDDANMEGIKVPVPRKQLGVRPGEERVFHYMLELLDQATMLPIGSAATEGEARITEFPIARVTQVRLPFLAAHLRDLYMNLVLETEVQSETETAFEVYVRANCDDPERTPIVRKQDGRPVEFKREIRASTGKVIVTIPLRVEDLYPALGDDSWGDVWITARVYDSQNRRWAQDEKTGQVWEKLHVLRLPPGATAAPEEPVPASAPAATQPDAG